MPDGRGYENLLLWRPSASSCEGLYGIPRIAPQRLPDIARWKPIGQLRGRDLRKTDGIQTFVYDYKLTGLWNRPGRYVDLLKRAGCVLSPDYSLYADVPRAVNLFQHYKKHWLGAWWQAQGIVVIPTICWAGTDSYVWCFDGEPRASVVAVSSVGTQRYALDKQGFLRGYDAMLERLKPETILLFGNIPEGCRGNVVPCEAFYKQMERRAGCQEQVNEV